jgi:hypothetical protein
VPEETRAQIRHSLEHSIERGIAEPAAERYWLRHGSSVTARIDGKHFTGEAGAPLRERVFQFGEGEGIVFGLKGIKMDGKRVTLRELRDTSVQLDVADVVTLHDPLKWLASLLDAADVRYAGEERLRGTPCRKVVAGAGPGQTTIWIDQEHVRQLQVLEVSQTGAARRWRPSSCRITASRSARRTGRASPRAPRTLPCRTNQNPRESAGHLAGGSLCFGQKSHP